MVLETGQHPGALKDMVTSPGGTTIEGLHELEKGKMRGTVMSAVIASAANANIVIRIRLTFPPLKFTLERS